MATTPWSIPTGKAITGATYIKDTDDNIATTIEDLVDWCNNANGTYNDYTLTGLRTDFLTKASAQTITAVTTVDTLGAIDFTGGELRIGGTAVTSTATELNVLDGVSATLTASELSILDGVTAVASDLNKTSSITSGSYTPTLSNTANISSSTTYAAYYSRIGNNVTVFTRIDIIPTSSGAVAFRISLPISSTFSSGNQGYGSLVAKGTTGVIQTVSTLTAISAYFDAPSTAGITFTATFSYLVV